MTLRTVECETKESLANMLYGLIHPLVAIEQEPISRKITGGSQF